VAVTEEDLARRAEIADALNRYAQGVDQRAWDVYMSAFSPDATIDVVGLETGPFTPQAFSEFLASTFDPVRLSGQHALSNTLHLFDEGRQRTMTEFSAVNLERCDDPERYRRQHALGIYVDDWVETADGWRIQHRTIAQKSNDEELRPYPAPIIEAVQLTLTADWFGPAGQAEGAPPAPRSQEAPMGITIQDLLDRAAISDVLVSYSQAQDQEQWELFDRVFAEDAELEFLGLGLGTMSPKQFRDFLVNQFNPTRLTGQHALSNTLYELHGDTARTITEMTFLTLSVTADENVLRRSRGTSLYVDDWVRTAEGWRIRHRVTAQKDVQDEEVAYAPEVLSTLRATASASWA
jgi:hypothetical protein